MPAKIKKVTASPVPTKKVVAKKAPAKKAIVKKVVAKKAKPVMRVKVSEQTVPVVTVVEKEVHTSHGPVEVHHKYVFIGTCRNCEHMPMSVNKLVAVLSIAIAILSGMLISTSLPMNFELPSISMGSITNWITPDSNVQNL
ncbi:hypothetical protein HY626_03040 [Candidatus Uhrbacteria bacterium]|nr:hypothetical protein [Candidatus Uhrbacteria bacterium]